MDYFDYKNGKLYAEDVDVSMLAEKFKTPLYIYSSRTIIEHLRKIKSAFKEFDTLVCYSVKANSNISILKLIAEEDAGFDVVSGGELFRVLKAGGNPKKIVYAGVGKTPEEIFYALKTGILMFNIESVEELQTINKIAKNLKIKADVALRINPDVDAHTHSYITTGKKENKFGINIILANSLFNTAKKYKHINIKGIDMHIGSQITIIQPYIDAIKKLKNFIEQIKSFSKNLEFFNIGGGMGIIYKDEKPATAAEFASEISPYIKDLNLKLIIEPGRFIVGNGGILVTSVIYNKKGINKNFLIVDAGMNDLIRPALYGAYHSIIPVKQIKGKNILYDIVGPICESADFLGKDRHLPDLKQGDLIAIRSAGAYGFVMSSNYNSRPRAAEVLVQNNKYKLIRKRETYEDLIKLEI
ncbi:MAG: diaminopimelate decarboxylase [Candidatus Goldbacteria bacterium]|nr:diaminopimelate decarboxylase [Candidatus Goldiibacteriota bacterium]